METHLPVTPRIEMPTEKLSFVMAITAEIISSDLHSPFQNRDHEEATLPFPNEKTLNNWLRLLMVLWINLAAGEMSTVSVVEVSNTTVIVRTNELMNHHLHHLIVILQVIATHLNL